MRSQVWQKYPLVVNSWCSPRSDDNLSHQKDASKPCLQWRKQLLKHLSRKILPYCNSHVIRWYQFKQDSIWNFWSYFEKSLLQSGYRTSWSLNQPMVSHTTAMKNQRDRWQVRQEQHGLDTGPGHCRTLWKGVMIWNTALPKPLGDLSNRAAKSKVWKTTLLATIRRWSRTKEQRNWDEITNSS